MGAARMYVSDEKWQQVVGDLIEVAAAFVIQGASSDGLGWELSKLVRRTTPSKILLLLPRSPKNDEAFRAWADRILPRRMPVALPRLATSYSLRFIAFRSDWEPYALEPKDLPWALLPFFRQNGFPLSRENHCGKEDR
jgi:hypothetical protein